MRGKARSLRPDHEGDQEVPEHRRDGGDHEEEDHEHAVGGEELVVGLGRDEVCPAGVRSSSRMRTA